MSEEAGEPTVAMPGFPDVLRERYAPRAVLGQGAFGRVYMAEDRRLGRKVAVKVLTLRRNPDAEARFTREAKILAAIEHPNVIRLYEHGRSAEGSYLVLEFLDGIPLENAPAGLDAVDAALQVAEGLAHLHARDLLHRDLKPANLMVDGSGRVVLLDFGLAADPYATALTRTGTAVGTPSFMSPEALRAAPQGPASDYYSLGATLFFLLEGGRKPYEWDTIQSVASGAIPLPPPPFHFVAPDSPEGRLVRALLVQDPADRIADPAAMRAVLAGKNPRPRAGRPQASTAEYLRPGDLSGPTGARIGMRRGGIFLGAVLLSLAAGAFLGRNDATSPGSDPTSQVRVLPPSSFDVALPERIRQELSDATGRILLADGSVVEAGAAGLPEGARELLSPDPWVWGETVRHLRELGRFFTWVENGGRPEELPEEIRRELTRSDEWFQNQDQPTPFAAFLEAAPAPAPVPFPASLDGFFLDLDPAESYPGWFGAVLTCHLELADLYGRREEEWRRFYRTGERSGEFPAELAGIPPALRFERLDASLGAFFMTPANRLPLARWFEEGRRTYRRLLYLATRALEEGDADPDLVLVTVKHSLHVHESYMNSAIGSSPPVTLVGRVPPGPAGAALMATVLRRQARVRFRMEGKFPEAHGRRVAWLESAIESPGSSPAARFRRAESTAELMEHFLDTGHPERALELFRRRRNLVDSAHHFPRARAWGHAFGACYQGGGSFDENELADARSALAECEAAGQDGPSLHGFREGLRRWASRPPVRRLSPDYPRRVKEELTDAQGLFLTREGELVEGGGAVDPGSRELLSPDWYQWRETQDHLPVLGEWYAWLRAGGRPENLPATTWHGLLDADRWYEGQGLPPTFGPFHRLAPTRRPVSLPPEMTAFTESLGLRVPPLQGWLGTFAAELVSTLRMLERMQKDLEESYRKGEAVGEFPPALLRVPSHVHFVDLERFFAFAGKHPEYRLHTGPWARPAILRARRAYAALGRSLVEEAETRELAGLLAARASFVTRLLAHAYLSQLEAGQLLGVPAETAPARLAQVSLEDRRASAVFRNTGRLTLPQAELERLWRRAMEPSFPTAPLARHRHAYALAHVHEYLVLQGDEPSARQMLRETLADLLEGPPHLTARTFRGVIGTWEGKTQEILEEELLGPMAAWVEAHPEFLPSDITLPGFREQVAALRARQARR